MKGLSYSFLRAVCALVIGLVLVMFPNQAGDYFVITIGVIFLVPSLISIIGYYAQNAEVFLLHHIIIICCIHKDFS